MKRLSWIFVLLFSAIALCQDVGSLNGEQSLTLETTGHGFWKPRRPFVFRTYSTADGTKADVRYLTFHSFEEAKQYIATCLKPGAKVIYRRQNKDLTRNVIDERIVAVTQESGKKDFALIRRIGMNGYFIGSSSLAAAIQLEEATAE